MKKQDFDGRLREVSRLVCKQCDEVCEYKQDCWKVLLINIIRDLVNGSE